MTQQGYLRRVDNQYLLGGSVLRRFGTASASAARWPGCAGVTTLATGSFEGLRYDVQAEVSP